MAIAAAGVYLAFDGGPDASGPDGPGIGPFDEIVLRGARAVGDRAGLGRIIALRSSAGRWRDAETDSSSAVSEQAEIGRADLRFSAGEDDVFVRFSDDQVAGHSSVPDLGPFAVVVVGTHDVRGDEETLAVRVSRISPWQLTDRAGVSFQGALKDALVFAPAKRSARSQPRTIVVAPEAVQSRAEVAGSGKATAAAQPDAAAGAGAADAAAQASEEAAPSVWVERAKPAPNIYISRPDRKR